MYKEVKRYRLEHNTPAREVEPGRDINLLRGTVMVTEADFGRAYDALLAERDALKKDAERYRWLRNTAMETGGVAPAVLMVDGACKPAFDESGYGHVSARSDATLDEAIDAALLGGKP